MRLETMCAPGPARSFALQFPGAFERPEFIRRIKRLIKGLVHTADLQEDLLQETLLHFWCATSEHPDKTLGWYLRSCHWHIVDFLKDGRSLDSIKNRERQCLFQEESQNPVWTPAVDVAGADDVVQNVSVRDTLRELSQRLAPPDTDVLLLLSQGHRLHEIAHALRLPQREVSRSRARIAETAFALEIRPQSRRLSLVNSHAKSN